MKFLAGAGGVYARYRRSPHGERGLKFICIEVHFVFVASLPARGAWIEILSIAPLNWGAHCRSPHGERGLKLLDETAPIVWLKVAPRTGSVD